MIGKASSADQLIGRDRDRRRDPHARGFGQQADGVVAERGRVLVAGPVVVVERVLQHARAPVFFERQRHRVPEQAGDPPDQRIVVAIDRIDVRRHEEARAARTHLVHRQEHLRMPAPVEEGRQRPVLRHVHHERVAVDVVADVVVVQPRHVAALELGALPLAIPVDGDDVAVGIERREEDQHHVAQRAEHLGIVRGRERVQQLRRRLRRGDLGRVNAHADRDDDRLALADGRRRGLVQGARIGEAQAIEANLFEPGEVFRGGHHRGNQPSSAGGRPGIDDVDAIRSRGERLEVALQAWPVGELAIRAHAESEERFRGLDRRRRRCLRAERRRQEQREEEGQRTLHRGLTPSKRCRGV